MLSTSAPSSSIPAARSVTATWASLSRVGRIDEVIAHYKTAAALGLAAAELLYNLGAALQSKATLADGVRSYERAIARRPDYLQAHYNCGNAQAA